MDSNDNTGKNSISNYVMPEMPPQDENIGKKRSYNEMMDTYKEKDKLEVV